MKIQKFKTAEEYIEWIEQELEGANYHDFTDLPGKLFNSICDIKEIPITLERELLIAKTIAEEFNKNI